MSLSDKSLVELNNSKEKKAPEGALLWILTAAA
jgi:hypothetical protein